MVTLASIGTVRPVHTGRLQTQDEVTAANAEKAAYLQAQYDAYNASYDEYNAAVETYKQAESSYNHAIEELIAAQQRGRSDEIQTNGIRAEGTAAAVNNALENLQQKEAAYNQSLFTLVSAGIITTDTASKNEIHNSYDKIDVNKLSGTITNAVAEVDSLNDYNSIVIKIQKGENRLRGIVNRYNAATTDEEREAIRDEYNAEVETTNANITQYNIALKHGQELGTIDKSTEQIEHIPKLVATPGVSAGTVAEPQVQETEKKPNSFFGVISNFLDDVNGAFEAKVDTSKLKDTGIGMLAVSPLAAAATVTGHIDDYVPKIKESLLGAQEALYKVGQFVNPSDENIVSVREDKISGIESLASDLQKSTAKDIAQGAALQNSDNVLASALGTSLVAGGMFRSFLIGGFGDLGKEAVSEKKSEEEQKQQAISNINTIASAVDTVGNALPTREGKYLANALESGIKMDADYIEHGMIDSEGNVHMPGVLHLTASILTGSAIGTVIGGASAFAAPTVSAAKSLAGDILGFGGGGAGLTLEGVSTSEHLASRGMTGAGRSIQQAGENAVVNPSSNVFKAEFINGVEGGFRITPGEIIDGVRGGMKANPGEVITGVDGGFKATQGEMIDGVRGGFKATPGDLLTGVDGGMKANPGEVITGVDGGFKATIGNMFNPFSGNADILGDGNYGSINANGYPMRKDRLVELETSGIKHSDLLRETDIFKDSNSYSHSDRYANDDLFGDSIAFPTSNRQSYETSRSLLHGTVFGNMLGNTFGERYKHENKTEYDYVYEYEYPARPARSKRTHDIDWDDDDILSQSRSRKKKSSRNDVWREILRL